MHFLTIFLENKKLEVLNPYWEVGAQEKIADILLNTSNDFSDVKLEAALILAGLTKMVGNARSISLQYAIIRQLIQALQNVTEKELLCQVLLAISFHGYSVPIRQDLFGEGLENILISKHSDFSDDVEITRAILLLLSSIFKPRPRMTVTEIEGLLPILSAALHSSDILTISYAAIAFSYLLEGDEGDEILAIDRSIAPTLVQLMMHTAIEVVEPALTAVGHIISGDDDMTQTMINLQVIPSLLWLIDYPNMRIRWGALWSMSTIAAGTHSQIQAVIDAGVIPRIMPFMSYWANESSEEVMLYEDTLNLLGNILRNGTNEQKRYLLTEHVFEAYCDALRNPEFLDGPGIAQEPKMRAPLDGIMNLLKIAKSDFVHSREIIYSLFKKEKLLVVLREINTSVHSSLTVVAWSREILELVKELNFE